MKLTTWAKQIGISYQTAWRHYNQGKIEGAYQLPSGTIIVPDKVGKQDYVVTYARVSSIENKSNLISQSKRLHRFCTANGWRVDQAVLEVGSGLNDKRKKLSKLLEEGRMTKLVVEHKDRLSRFGTNYLVILCSKINCELVIINESSSDKEDLISDFIAVITSFCARIYGLRRRSRRTELLIEELSREKASVGGKNTGS